MAMNSILKTTYFLALTLNFTTAIHAQDSNWTPCPGNPSQSCPPGSYRSINSNGQPTCPYCCIYENKWLYCSCQNGEQSDEWAQCQNTELKVTDCGANDIGVGLKKGYLQCGSNIGTWARNGTPFTCPQPPDFNIGNNMPMHCGGKS